MKQIRFACYCRVSTNKEDQANSFEAQQRFFRDYARQQPDWELYAIYADEGITGTATKKRTRFNEMIQDAYSGKFRMILTKEVSRFSRNILDTISYTRELRSIGVGVLFLTDRINTMEPESEMLLSFLATLAQEESRRTSTRVVWGQTRQMERGVVFGRSMLGYDVKNGQLSVEPEGAELVRLIYHKYAVEQTGTTKIARFLTEGGYRTSGGSKNWTPGAVVKILKNEKYVGDLIQKKSYTPDYLTHQKRKNTGQVPLITIRNHHEPIVSREIWNMAQSRLAANNKHNNTCAGRSNRYLFSGKIRCGVCGSVFVSRLKCRKDGTKVRRWRCGNVVRNGSAACTVGWSLRDEAAVRMLFDALGSLNLNRGEIAAQVADLLCENSSGAGKHIEQLDYQIEKIQRKKLVLLDSYLSLNITEEEMSVLKREYENRIAALQTRAEEEIRDRTEREGRREQLKMQVESILAGETVSEIFLKSVLDGVTVFKDRHVELTLLEIPQVFRYSELSLR